jgi:4-amino-4-deoxy-L-arabinose transferase-like glycosyltransferase
MLAAFALATSILLGIVARLATIDASLLLTTIAAQGALARVYLGRASPGQSAGDWPLVAIFWTAIAGSILLKGPIIPLIVGLTAAALAIADRSARWLLRLKPVLGLIWVLVLVLPWFLVILSRSEGAFYGQSVGRDFFGRLTEGAEGTARRPVITGSCSGSASGRRRRSPHSPLRLPGPTGASPCFAFCSPGSCRAGSYSSWWSPSSRIMCCRSIRRSRS